MDKAPRGSILKKWKTACKSNATGIKLPKGFLFSEENGVLTMTFQTKRGFGLDRSPCNMQENGAAFEGWALAVYVHYLDRKGRVCLDIPENLPEPDESLYTKYPHFSRFLYRAIRFSEQYPWFQLSGRLEALTKAFERFLNRYHFTNNLPTRPAGEKGNWKALWRAVLRERIHRCGKCLEAAGFTVSFRLVCSRKRLRRKTMFLLAGPPRLICGQYPAAP